MSTQDSTLPACGRIGRPHSSLRNGKVPVDKNDPDGLKLLDAAQKGDTKEIMRLLATGVPVDFSDTHGMQAIHFAAEEGREEAVRILLAAGARAGAKRKHVLRKKPASLALSAGNPEVVKMLLVAQAQEIKTLASLSEDLLEEICCIGGDDWVQLLLGLGMRVDATDYAGEQLIHRMAEKGKTKMLRLLLSLGAKVDARENSHAQPIHLAAKNGHLEAVKWLLSEGAKVDAADDQGRQPIHGAAASGRMEVLEFLLAAGVDPRANAGCEEPLHRAAQNGRFAAVRRLMAAGVPADAVDSEGKTAGMLAREGGYEELAGWLEGEGRGVA